MEDKLNFKVTYKSVGFDSRVSQSCELFFHSIFEFKSISFSVLNMKSCTKVFYYCCYILLFPFSFRLTKSILT